MIADLIVLLAGPSRQFTVEEIRDEVAYLLNHKTDCSVALWPESAANKVTQAVNSGEMVVIAQILGVYKGFQFVEMASHHHQC